MSVSRRAVVSGLAALGLAACGGGAAVSRASRAAAAPEPAVPNPAFDAWVAAFRTRAAGQGISAATLSAAFADTGYLPGVIERDRNQTEFRRSLEDYLGIATSDERLSQGRVQLARHAGLLREIEDRYGVPPRIVVAIWGLESRYGQRRGSIPVISALSTLAFDGRRGAFFEGQLIAALRILQRGDVTPARMLGSWAGAMGHTQFIPTSYQEFAVDFRGDGRRDIWSDDPTDALASAAAYLSRNGWVRGAPWGAEAGTPAAAGLSGPRIQPDAGGPVFVAGPNFRVIKRYNNSDAYAIGVGHLSDRIAGGEPLRTAFGPDANGLTQEDRRVIQRRLTAAGYDTGGVDGVVGPGTQEAISAYQRANGLAVTGQPSRELLARLR